jgi:hypothetical protein
MDNPLAYHASDLRHAQKRGDFLLDLQHMKRVLNRYVRLFTLPRTTEIAYSSQISDPLWRDSVQAAFFRYLVAPMCTTHMEDPAEHELLERALSGVRSRQFWEHSSILACAVWKAQCLLQMPKHGGLYAHQQYGRSGWKRRKLQQRESVAISTIISTVRPFLDPLARNGSGASYTPDNTSGKKSAGRTMHFNSTDEALLKYLDGSSSWLPLVFSVTNIREYQFHDGKECRLCNRSDMDENAQRFHFFDELHKEREQTLQIDWQHIKKVMRRMVRLGTKPMCNTLAVLEQIHDRSGRNSVQASLYCYLTDSSPK